MFLLKNVIFYFFSTQYHI